MKLVTNLKRGRVWNIIQIIDRSINYYSKKHNVKVGITSNPKNRKTSYERETDYDKMVLLKKTQSKENVKSLEKNLINYHWDSIDNQIGGGGGPLGKPPYYLYIVTKQRYSIIQDLFRTAGTLLFAILIAFGLYKLISNSSN